MSEIMPVTDAEAREILSRFIASHFGKPDREHARFSIPAREDRDDDLRLSRYITETEQLRAALAEAQRERDEAKAERAEYDAHARALWEQYRAECDVSSASEARAAEMEKALLRADELLSWITFDDGVPNVWPEEAVISACRAHNAAALASGRRAKEEKP